MTTLIYKDQHNCDFWYFVTVQYKYVTDLRHILREDVNGQDFMDILVRPSFLWYTNDLLRY